MQEEDDVNNNSFKTNNEILNVAEESSKNNSSSSYDLIEFQSHNSFLTKFEPSSSSRYYSNNMENDVIVISDDDGDDGDDGDDTQIDSAHKDDCLNQSISDAYNFRERKRTHYEIESSPSDIENEETDTEKSQKNLRKTSTRKLISRKNATKWDIDEITHLVYFAGKYGRAWTLIARRYKEYFKNRNIYDMCAKYSSLERNQRSLEFFKKQAEKLNGITIDNQSNEFCNGKFVIRRNSIRWDEDETVNAL